MGFRWAGWLGLLIAAVGLASVGAPAEATFPGANGKIAFVRYIEGGSHIFVMNADGSGVTRLTQSPGYDWGPAWSPDGTKIAFTRAPVEGMITQPGDIYVMNTDGGGLVNLTNDSGVDGFPAWSPDGSLIAFSSYRDGNENFEIFVIASDGSGLRQITSAGNGYVSQSPSWSPDGTAMAFERGGQTMPSDICVMRAEGGGEANLTNSPEFDMRPDWSPDGSRILFTHQQDGLMLYTLDPDRTGAPSRLISEGGGEASWSPDGTKIAVVRGGAPSSNSAIWVINADGTGGAQLSDGSASDDDPAWQPLPGQAGMIAPSAPHGIGQSSSPAASISGCVPVLPSPLAPSVAPEPDQLPVDGGSPSPSRPESGLGRSAVIVGAVMLVTGAFVVLIGGKLCRGKRINS